MSDAPSLGNVKPEGFGQLQGSLLGHGISPGAEGNQQFILVVECHVSVHHGGKSHGSQCGQIGAILSVHVRSQLRVSVLQTAPDGLKTVSPDTVHQLVLPGVIPLGNNLIPVVYQHCLDAGGAQLNPKGGAAVHNIFSVTHTYSPNTAL